MRTDNNGPDMMLDSNEEKFDFEWPEDRFKDLREGEIIEAKVIIVRDDAAFVDIGGKSDLVIPLAELTDKQVPSAKQLVKAGDVIRVMVTRTGDEERILLSKRLVEQQQIWFDLEDAFRKELPVEGTVTDVVKAGLNINLSGIKAFMPASQSGVSNNLESLVGQKMMVKILEFDRAKKRVLVSRRVLVEAERRKNEGEFFRTIQEGERRKGTVTRLTDFGAFVDLGSGIEGLIHVSELSWNRVKTPHEVVKEGEQVEVQVIKVDQSAKKISLSMKQLQVHPWQEASLKFQENQVYTGTVVRMEPFGAFIRLAPGVDGMVHVSQISEKRIGKPDEVLTIGQEVQAKILKIDSENRKISLSLREVGEDQNKQEMEQFLNSQADGNIGQNLGELFKQKK